jgi:hypothetical protein
MYMREKTDLDTVFLLTETLSRVYPEMEIEVKSPEKFSDLDLHKLGDRVNLVVIGGPDYNIVAKEFNHETPYRYIYEGQDIYLENLLTGKIHRPIFNEDNKSATDFGFLVRTNLYSGSSKLLIIGGCRTWGVYGAALLLSSNVNQKNNSMLASLVKKFGKKTSICVPIEANGSLSAMHQPKWDIGDVFCKNAHPLSSPSPQSPQSIITPPYYPNATTLPNQHYPLHFYPLFSVSSYLFSIKYT